MFYVSGCLWEEVDRLFERWPQMEVGLYLIIDADSLFKLSVVYAYIIIC